MKIKEYKLQIPIYDCEIDVWIGGTEKDYIQKVKKYGVVTEDGRIGCYWAIKKKDSNKVVRRILWVGKKNNYLILHETFHAVVEIMAYKNILLIENTNGEYMDSTEEAWAYFLEWLYKKVMSL